MHGLCYFVTCCCDIKWLIYELEIDLRVCDNNNILMKLAQVTFYRLLWIFFIIPSITFIWLKRHYCLVSVKTRNTKGHQRGNREYHPGLLAHCSGSERRGLMMKVCKWEPECFLDRVETNHNSLSHKVHHKVDLFGMSYHC